MNIKEQVISRAFKEVNCMSAIVSSCDTFVKLPSVGKKLVKRGLTHTIHNHKWKRP